MEVVIVAVAQKEKEADNMDEGWGPIYQPEKHANNGIALSGRDSRATEGFFPK